MTSLLDHLCDAVKLMAEEWYAGGVVQHIPMELIKDRLHKCLQDAPPPSLPAKDKNIGAQIFNNCISPERIREVLDYDYENGALRWKGRPTARPSWNARFTGKIAGHKDKTTGYMAIRIDGKLFLAHRVAWAHVYGEWPEDEIDHRNRVGADNRLLNMRPATRNDNLGNRSVPINSKSGIKGVSWDSKKKKWMVRVTRQGVRYYFGTYSSIDEARKASDAGMKNVYGEYAKVG